MDKSVDMLPGARASSVELSRERVMLNIDWSDNVMDCVGLAPSSSVKSRKAREPLDTVTELVDGVARSLTESWSALLLDNYEREGVYLQAFSQHERGMLEILIVCK